MPRADVYRRLAEDDGYRERERRRAAARRARRKADLEADAAYKQADRQRARLYRAQKKLERPAPAGGPGLSTAELAERIGAHPATVERLMLEELRAGRVHRSRGGRGRWRICPSAFPPGTLEALALLADLAPNGDAGSAATVDRLNGHTTRMFSHRHAPAVPRRADTSRGWVTPPPSLTGRAGVL